MIFGDYGNPSSPSHHSLKVLGENEGWQMQFWGMERKKWRKEKKTGCKSSRTSPPLFFLLPWSPGHVSYKGVYLLN